MKAPICPRCEVGPPLLLHEREGSSAFEPSTGEWVERTICIFKCKHCGCEFPHVFVREGTTA